MTTTMMGGTVRRYYPAQGFGFIKRDDNADVFVHANDLKRAGIATLNDGDRVEVDAEMAPKGLRVRSIALVERAN